MSDARVEPVGLIGLGLMGSALALSLRHSGFVVHGFDTSDSRMEEDIHQGGRRYASASEATQGLSTVLLSLPSGREATEVCLGDDGIASTLAQDALIIDTTTAAPVESSALATQLGDIRIRYVDACISGSSNMVASRDIVVVAGGSAEDIERAATILNVLARSVHHMGPVGTGSRTKLIVNLVLGAHRLALAEGLILAEKARMETSAVLDVLRDSAAYSKAMDVWGQRMVADRPAEPTSRIRQHHKDVRLMLDEGGRLAAPLWLTSVLDTVLEIAESQGHAEADLSILLETLRHVSRSNTPQQQRLHDPLP
jgi:3-hydroxyisobutyrate dehydrogenase-like beta-hydroxyacid dehydrogenase